MCKWCLLTVLMLWCFTYLGIGKAIGCKKADGTPVPWWFIMKLGEYNHGGAKHSRNYVYYDRDMSLVAANNALHIAGNPIDDNNSPLKQTLTPLYARNVNYAVWNDQPPGIGNPGDKYAHAKGILAFDALVPNQPGFWITHSQPKWPQLEDRTAGMEYCNKDDYVSVWRDCKLKFSQSFLCISFLGHLDNTLENIIDQLVHMRPYVYSSRIQPGFVPPENFNSLRNTRKVLHAYDGIIRTQPFGMFQHYSKPSSDDAIKLIHYINDNYFGSHRSIWLNFDPNSKCSEMNDIRNVQIDDIQFADKTHCKIGIQIWSTKEHVKQRGGASGNKLYRDGKKLNDKFEELSPKRQKKRKRKHTTPPFSQSETTCDVKLTGIEFRRETDNIFRDGICIGDLNRATTQDYRGGGYICFRNPNFALALGTAFGGDHFLMFGVEKKYNIGNHCGQNPIIIKVGISNLRGEGVVD